MGPHRNALRMLALWMCNLQSFLLRYQQSNLMDHWSPAAPSSTQASSSSSGMALLADQEYGPAIDFGPKTGPLHNTWQKQALWMCKLQSFLMMYQRTNLLDLWSPVADFCTRALLPNRLVALMAHPEYGPAIDSGPNTGPHHNALQKLTLWMNNLQNFLLRYQQTNLMDHWSPATPSSKQASSYNNGMAMSSWL